MHNLWMKFQCWFNHRLHVDVTLATTFNSPWLLIISTFLQVLTTKRNVGCEIKIKKVHRSNVFSLGFSWFPATHDNTLLWANYIIYHCYVHGQTVVLTGIGEEINYFFQNQPERQKMKWKKCPSMEPGILCHLVPHLDWLTVILSVYCNKT
jgi:hypothetical protein